MPQSEEDKTKQSLCQQGRKFIADVVDESIAIPSDIENHLEKARLNMLLNQMPRPLTNFVIDRMRRSYGHRYAKLVRSEMPDRINYVGLIVRAMENSGKKSMFR